MSGCRIVIALLLALALLFLCLGCGGKSSSTPIPAPADLQPESALKDNLCNWPAQEFSPSNHVSAQLAFGVGQYAIDFTLRDPSGTSYNLGALLQAKPVFLIFGSCT